MSSPDAKTENDGQPQAEDRKTDGKQHSRRDGDDELSTEIAPHDSREIMDESDDGLTKARGYKMLPLAFHVAEVIKKEDKIQEYDDQPYQTGEESIDAREQTLNPRGQVLCRIGRSARNCSEVTNSLDFFDRELEPDGSVPFRDSLDPLLEQGPLLLELIGQALQTSEFVDDYRYE